MRVLIAGGGTAGHVNPAIALAEALDGDVLFLGTRRGVESRIVPEAGHELHEIEVRGFDRSRPWQLPVVGIKALGAVAQARRAIKSFGPSCVVGMGGYVSLPAVLGARSAGVPVVLHEQNAVLGLAHRVSKPLARRVAVSFEETLEQTGSKGVLTGNPVLGDLARLDRSAARTAGIARFELDTGRKTLLVFGGSLGARSVNDAAAGLAQAWRDRDDLQVVHITGSKDFGRVNETVQRAGEGPLIYRVREYVSEMAEAYAAADLALCRGGATTVAELCLVGLPSIIVPYPHHRDRQQERHGRSLERAGAAQVLLDVDASTETVAAAAESLLSDADRLQTMTTAALELARPDAAQRLADVVREVGA